MKPFFTEEDFGLSFNDLNKFEEGYPHIKKLIADKANSKVLDWISREHVPLLEELRSLRLIVESDEIEYTSLKEENERLRSSLALQNAESEALEGAKATIAKLEEALVTAKAAPAPTVLKVAQDWIWQLYYNNETQTSIIPDCSYKDIVFGRGEVNAVNERGIPPSVRAAMEKK